MHCYCRGAAIPDVGIFVLGSSSRAPSRFELSYSSTPVGSHTFAACGSTPAPSAGTSTTPIDESGISAEHEHVDVGDEADQRSRESCMPADTPTVVNEGSVEALAVTICGSPDAPSLSELSRSSVKSTSSGNSHMPVAVRYDTGAEHACGDGRQ